ncbi:hypothetical protein ONO86_06107 [Micromonospora noduli]|nr:hypothetical protein ONO86_06107 [Micromonospora noduli]
MEHEPAEHRRPRLAQQAPTTGRVADRAERRLQCRPLGRVGLGDRRLSFRLGRLDQRRRRVERRADTGQPAGHREHRLASFAGLRVAGQPAGPTHVALRGRRRPLRHVGRDAVPTNQHLGHRVGRRLPQGYDPTARPDGHRDVVRVGGRSAEQEDRPRWGFLDRLEQRIAGGLGEPVGVLDDHHLPAPAGRGAGRAEDERTHLADADGESFRHHHPHVGVGAAHGGVAAGALAAAGPVHALQCGGERPCGDRAAGAGWAGEDPRVRHPGGRIHPAGRGVVGSGLVTAGRAGGDQRGHASTQHGGCRGGGAPQLDHRLVLTDQVGEDVRHQVLCSIVTSSASDNSGCTEVSGPCAGRGCTMPPGLPSISSTRRTTSPVISSAGRDASSTR